MVHPSLRAFLGFFVPLYWATLGSVDMLRDWPCSRHCAPRLTLAIYCVGCGSAVALALCFPLPPFLPGTFDFTLLAAGFLFDNETMATSVELSVCLALVLGSAFQWRRMWAATVAEITIAPNANLVCVPNRSPSGCLRCWYEDGEVASTRAERS